MVIEGKPPLTLHRRVKNLGLKLQRDTRISAINKQVRKQTDPDPKEQPIVFFNPSTRLSGFSQNAAFGLLACWGLQIANQIVVHFTCQGVTTVCGGVIHLHPARHVSTGLPAFLRPIVELSFCHVFHSQCQGQPAVFSRILIK